MHRMTRTMAWLATGLAAAASTAGLLTDSYRDTPAMIDQARGADLATLLLAVPLLAIALRQARDGSPFAGVAAAGALAYLVYTYAIFAFQVMFNPLTPVYIAILGLATWALAFSVPGLLATVTNGTLQPRLPRRATAGFLALVAVAFAGLWLGQIGRAIASGGQPEAVVDLGVPTSGVYALDLAFVLPVFAVASVLVARRSTIGPWIAYGSLVFSVLMALGIVGALWMEAVRGTLDDPTVVVGFVVVSAVAITLTALGTRSGRHRPSLAARGGLAEA